MRYQPPIEINLQYATPVEVGWETINSFSIAAYIISYHYRNIIVADGKHFKATNLPW